MELAKGTSALVKEARLFYLLASVVVTGREVWLFASEVLLHFLFDILMDGLFEFETSFQLADDLLVIKETFTEFVLVSYEFLLVLSLHSHDFEESQHLPQGKALAAHVFVKLLLRLLHRHLLYHY